MLLEKFFREEQKYYITKEQYNLIINGIKDYIVKDKYFKEQIFSIYFDNDNDDLIINSLDKPVYKEKIRLRSYGIPNDKSLVFFEIKKKYNGLVNKRRIIINYIDAKNYVNKGIVPKCNKQIFNEIDYCFERYNLKPKVCIMYARIAYLAKNDLSFRITFDSDIKCSDIDPKFNIKSFKSNEDEGYIMEIKSLNAIPLWFIKVLDNLKIYPCSYSKYGEIYKNIKESEVYV